jgi:Flp pilus assembly protein TadD
LFPVLGFFDAQDLTWWRVSDHLQYLPMIAPVALAAAILGPGTCFFRCMAAVAVLALSVLAFERARIFSSEETLLRDTLARNPAAWEVQNDLGILLAGRGDQAAAVDHFKSALGSNPDYADAHANLGQILLEQGEVEEAEKHFLAALKTQPHQVKAHRSLGKIMAQRGKPGEALRHLRVVLLFEPDVQTRLECAALSHQTGDYVAAAAQFRQVLLTQPSSVEALNNLAWLLATCPDETVRNGAEAVRCAERASRLPAPEGMCVPGTLAAAYAEAGRFKEAVATAEKAIETETAAGETRFADLNRQLLTLYRAGQPFHEPPVRQRNPYSVDGN